MAEQLKSSYDVLVIGGGAAGLSGALTLARARRSVVVIDAGTPRNAPAAGVHGLLARDGISPAELLKHGRDEVHSYGGQVIPGQVHKVIRTANGFSVSLTNNQTLHGRRLLVATGLIDELPDIPGLSAQWGQGVVHCPYCHGWEIRDQAIGVLASGPLSVHQALLFRQWSDDIVFFAHAILPLTEQDAEQLAARNIRIVYDEVTSLEIVEGRLTGVRLSSGMVVSRTALAVSSRMVARADFLAEIGLKTTQHPSGIGEFIPADPTGRTNVPGVWVAGNISDLAAQVGVAAAAGTTAGAHINADLVMEETRKAVLDSQTKLAQIKN